MQQVKTAIGKDNPFPFFPEVFKDPSEVFSFLDLFLHLLTTYQIRPCESNPLGSVTSPVREHAGGPGDRSGHPQSLTGGSFSERSYNEPWQTMVD